MSVIRSAYDHAPVLAQNAMLSGYGLWLHFLRYGAQHRALIEHLRASEQQPEAVWRAKQFAALRGVTATAQADVPFYRDRIPKGGIRTIDEFLGLPILTKAEAQAAGRALVSRRYAAASLQEIHTGGTTGTPLTIHVNRAALRQNYAFFFQLREWAGVRSTDRVATFAGRTIVAPDRGPPYWRHNWAARTMLCSSYHLAPDTIDDYITALRRFGPALIDTYPSSLEPIARRILERGDRPIAPRAIITSSETLRPDVREAAETAFGCKVFDHYGSAEMVALINQCEYGQYHAHPAFGYTEILVDGRSALPGETGEIVSTGFVNPVMPLIRWRTGDLATAGEAGCPCGRTSPTVRAIIGRQDDVIVTPRGRRIGRLDPIFKAVTSIHEARIVQDRADHVRVELVPIGVIPESEREALRDELQRRLGDEMLISILDVPRLERTAGGKLRTVVNEYERQRASEASREG